MSRWQQAGLLFPALMVAWLLAVVLTGAQPWVGVVVGGGCAAVAVVGALQWREHPGGWPVAVASAGVAGLVVALSAAGHVGLARADPWPELVRDRALVQAQVQVVASARPVARPAGWDAADGQQRTVARVLAVAVDDAAWQVGSRVRLVAPLPAAQGLLQPGQVVVGSMRVSPDDGRDGMSATLTAIEPVVAVQSAHGWGRAVRERLRSALARVPPAQAELVMGMVLGDDELLPEPVQVDMQSAGLSHLTAVSGANIAIVTGMVLWCARLTGVPRRFALIPALLALCGYVALVGPEPSVVRATAMALIGLLALALGGGSGMAALQVAALGLLVLDPWLASSRGFALSCAATAGLIVAAEPGRRLVAGVSLAVPMAVRAPVAVVAAAVLTALAAAIATAPLLAAYGQGVSWVSVLANVAAAPMVPVVTIAGLGVGAVAWVLPAVAQVVAAIPGAGADWIITVAQWAAAVPGGRVPWPAGWFWAVVLAGVLAALLMAGRRWRWLPIVVPAAVAAASVTAATAPTALGSLPSQWAVVFCDVGQGDAALLRAGPHAAVLLDAGPDPAAAQACLARSGITEVPMIVLSHFHRDHVAGLATVLAQYRPQRVLVSPLAQPADTYASTMRDLAAASVTPAVPQVGDRFTVGWLSWTVVGPSRLPGDGSAPNNASLTLTATVEHDGARTTVFFGGDLEPEGQLALMSGGGPIDVDVVKVPHHGSAQQHPRLPSWTGGEVAVMSCGVDNDYGHPSPLTVASWQGAGAAVVRTDLAGDVIMAGQSNGRPTVLTRAVARPR
ncbi:MAG: ComEC/Rec2 family competence protein [Actinomycetota bacterium]|nr:ComEC/Rec2 family competence protein [Actinomycetota bacterium]